MNLWISINSTLWSLSYVFLNIGISGILFTFCDILHHNWRGKKTIKVMLRGFKWLGWNSFITYLFTSLLTSIFKDIHVKNTNLWDFIYTEGFLSWINSKSFASLFMAFVFFLLIFFINFLLWYRRISIRP